MQSIPGGSGLVYSATSHTAGASGGRFITVDAKAKRLSRMRKAVITGSRLQVEDLQRGGFRFQVVMITATYAPESEWGARDMTALTSSIREWCRRRSLPCRYQWVMELHKSGRPHYHLLMFVPHGVRFPKPDARGWWAQGMTRIELGRKAGAMGHYLSKYLSKGSTALAAPRGARMHGSGGLDAPSRLERAWWLLPKWVRDSFGQADRAVKVTGGWMSRATGELLASPWVIVGRCPEWSWVTLRSET